MSDPKISLAQIARGFQLGREEVPTRCVGRVIDILDGRVVEADHQGAIAHGLRLIDLKRFPFERSTWWWDPKLRRPLVKSPCDCWLLLYPQQIDVVLAHLSDLHDGKTKGYKLIDDKQVYDWLVSLS